jgi:hypothetical protein
MRAAFIAALWLLAEQATGPVKSPPPAAPVRNEVPAAGATPGTWTLQAAPAYGAQCYRNGLRQSPTPPVIDYTLTGNVIASPFWQPGDTLLCDY